MTLCLPIFAQSGTFIESGTFVIKGRSCSWDGIPVRGVIHVSASNNDVVESMNKIVDAVGLQANFTIRGSDVPDALSTVDNGKRIIFYNLAFLNRIDQECQTNWASMSILAHELGHQYNNDPMDGGNTTIYYELAADEFSGFVLHKLHASLEEAKVAAQRYLPEGALNNYPPKSRRLEAIEKGWRKDEPVISEDFKGFIAALPKKAVAKPHNDDPQSIHYSGDAHIDLHTDNGKLYVLGSIHVAIANAAYDHMTGAFGGSTTITQSLQSARYPFTIRMKIDGWASLTDGDHKTPEKWDTLVLNVKGPDEIECSVFPEDDSNTVLMLILYYMNFKT